MLALLLAILNVWFVAKASINHIFHNTVSGSGVHRYHIITYKLLVLQSNNIRLQHLLPELLYTSDSVYCIPQTVQ